MNDADYRALIERAHQVRELTKEPGWQVLVNDVTAQAGEWNKRLLGGHATTVEEYRAWAGRVQGLKAFLDIPDELEAKVEAERQRRREAA